MLLTKQNSATSPLGEPIGTAGAYITASAIRNRTTPSKSLTVQSQWGTVELLDRIADEWRELCHEGPCDQPFFRPEWIASALGAFGNKRRLLLITVRECSHLRGVLPLWEEKTWACGVPVTKLCSAGNANHSPRFDFVHGCEPGVQEVVKAAWEHLQNLTGWDVIQFSNVPQGAMVERILRSAKSDGFLTYQYQWAQSPYIVLNGHTPESAPLLCRLRSRLESTADFAQLVSSRKFRHRLRHSWRKLQKSGDISLCRVEAADPEALQSFYCLEQKGWKGKKGTAIACKKETKQFYDSIAKSAAEYGYLSLHFLLLNGSPVAAHFALTYAGRYYPLKVAYDENYSQYGPGHLIIGAVLQDCLERGLTEFDFLGHWTEAKSKWASEVRSHNFSYIFRKGIVGRMLYAETYLSHKVQSALRSWIHSLRVFSKKNGNRNEKSPDKTVS